MNSKTLSKIHKFGKAGKLVMTVLMVVAMIAAAATAMIAMRLSAPPAARPFMFPAPSLTRAKWIALPAANILSLTSTTKRKKKRNNPFASQKISFGAG